MHIALWRTYALCLICSSFQNAATALRLPRRGLFDNWDLEGPGLTATRQMPATTNLLETATTVSVTEDSAIHTTSGATISSLAHKETVTPVHTYSIIGSISPPPQPTASFKDPLMPASVTPTMTESLSHPQKPTAGASTFTSTAELALWKVLGVTVLCIGVVATIILSIVFFDSWWGFLKDVVLGKKRRETSEELVPDWEKRSWEVRFASQDGHRYPSLSSVDSISKWKDVKGDGLGESWRKQRENIDGQKIANPTPTYLPDYDPHRPHWLAKAV